MFGRKTEDHLIDDEGEEELQRVDVEEDDEDQDGVQPDRSRVLEPVASEKDVVLVPERDEHREADPEGEEATHDVEELGERAGHLQGDDEEGHRERENGVGEALDARDLAAPPPEA